MKFNATLSLAIVLILVVAAVGIVFILTYNGLVTADKTVEGAKAQIETVCQRRLDLIPNLVQTVKGYAKHERDTLTAIIQARSSAQQALEGVSSKKSLGKEEMAALAASQSALTGALKSIFALVERYPDLKASRHFLALQDQLEGTENRISVARQRYNASARNYNTKINTFPGNIIAPVFGFMEKVYFEAKEEAQEPPKVEF